MPRVDGRMGAEFPARALAGGDGRTGGGATPNGTTKARRGRTGSTTAPKNTAVTMAMAALSIIRQCYQK